ncbi:MAG TPA: TrkA C-terminal domain-containing protein [Polyangiaceae bacterium LLY-WYZ-14_1]|nr:TrkA C-terminal domain-containing protein [Polyangiaceae bacterium LLY-WYZ-14_1]
MVPVVSLLLVVALSLFVTRVATVILVHTGLSRESARFQARSAFTGVGFTTGEAEAVVRHPVRRKVVTTLMLLGNAGLATAVASLILGLSGGADPTGRAVRLAAMLAGVGVLFWASTNRWADRKLSALVSWALHRYTRLDVRDYGSLLELSGPYRVVELHVQDDDWLAEETLASLDLRAEGVVVLGVRRPSGRYLGVPSGGTEVRPGDVLVCYGRREAIDAIDERRRGWAGESEHREAVRQQTAEAEREQREDAASAEEERQIAERERSMADDADREEETDGEAEPGKDGGHPRAGDEGDAPAKADRSRNGHPSR